MKKLLLALVMLIVLMSLPIAAALVVTLNSNAVAACDSDSQASGPPGRLERLERLALSPGRWRLSHDQAANAAVIAGVARDLRINRYGVEVALAAALQESSLVNLAGGDRDSAGLFQQRPSQGWGTFSQVTDPVLAAHAFFGRATHTDNAGLLDIPGWRRMPVTQAAQAVQRSGYPEAYARWKEAARSISGAVVADDTMPVAADSQGADCNADGLGGVTVATLNLLGAGHTDGKPGGGHESAGYASWEQRLPGELGAIAESGASVAGLQEVHAPQARVLAGRFSGQWDIYPETGRSQNRVIWDPSSWALAEARLVDIPYFGGRDVGMPLVKLTGPAGTEAAGRSLWVWSVHNAASTRGDASGIRARALRRELAVLTTIVESGVPVVIVGDFNDGRDGKRSSHCVLTPTLTNSFGGVSGPCRPPQRDARLDHIYGANLTWAKAWVDTSTRPGGLSDHPLVVATTAPTSDCADEGGSLGGGCGPAAYPVPSGLVGTDEHNWHASGGLWSSWHTGTDFAVPCGTSVLAAHAGTVEIDTTQAWAGPRLVKIVTGRHSLATWYAHLESVSVARGQGIRAGQQIGRSGRAGNASGCHLHFEVHLQNGSIYGPDNVDPSAWLDAHVAPRGRAT